MLATIFFFIILFPKCFLSFPVHILKVAFKILGWKIYKNNKKLSL